MVAEITRRQLNEDVEQALIHMIRRVEDAQERAAREYGMHPTDFRCLGFLKSHGKPASPKEIIAYLGLTSGAGTALLDRLEAAGFIKRLGNPDDRRSYLIWLDTEAAADPLALSQHIQEKYRAATADLSDENLQAIAFYLGRIQTLSAELNAALYGGAV
ncbi:MarR family winged helix-turn-helix transcriptional regulator [Devosia sp. A369]